MNSKGDIVIGIFMQVMAFLGIFYYFGVSSSDNLYLYACVCAFLFVMGELLIITGIIDEVR